PYLAQYAAVTLRSGAMSTRGRLTYRAGRDRPIVTYTGSVDVDRMRVVEAASGAPLLSWQSGHGDRLRLGRTPAPADIAEVRVTGLAGTLVVLKDKSLGAMKLVKAPSAPTPPPPANTPAAGTQLSTAAKAPAPSNAAKPVFPVAIERVRI